MSTRFTSGPASFTSGPTKGAIPSRTTSPIRGASPAPPASNSRGRDTKSPAAVRTPSASKKEVDTPVKGARAKTPTQLPEPKDDQELEKVKAWQSEVDLLEQQQMKIQQDQMNLLHNQIHILTRELGDLQNKFMYFQTDLQAAQEEAHSALRLELAEHGNNAAEMKAAWEEAHNALKDAMDDGLSDLAEKHAQALEDHKAEHAKALGDLGGGSGNSLADMEAIHNQRYEEHTASLEQGLEGVHSTLQKELAELRSGHAVNLQAVVTDVTDQVDKLTKDVEQMAEDLKAAQEEAHSALRLELAEHGNNAAEMKAAWEEAHNALTASMDDNLAALADQHAKALDDHKAEQAAALADHADNLANHGSNLSDLEDLHNKRAEEHSACLEKGLEDVHGTLQKELAELKSGHAVNLQAVVTDITEQLDKLTKDVEVMAEDLKQAQEEAHSALRLELAEHGNNAEDMKAAWEEAHKALTASMDDNLAALADQHAKALEDHKADQAAALAEHADNLGNTGSNLAELEDVHNKRYEEHTACLQAGLDGVHSTLQKELEELRSGHAVNLQAVVADVTTQVDKLTLDVEQMATDLKAAQEEAHSALRLELAEHGNNADEMKAAWEEAHKALTASLDDNLASMAKDHADALENHKAEHAAALEGHGGSLGDLEDLHNKRYEEHSACLQQGLDGVHDTLQKELAELKSGHAVNLQAVVTDVTAQVDKLTLDVEQLAKDVLATQEEAHSALRLELAEHGNNADEMKAAWEEAHKALSQSLDDNLASLAADQAKALEDHKNDHARALADHAETHGNTVADVQAALRGEMENQASSMRELYDAKHAEHTENTAKMEAGLQSVLDSTHSKLQDELADLRSGHATNLKQILEDVAQQTDNLTLSLEQEAELRKIMEIKLDKMFEGMRGLMAVSFLGDMDDQPQPEVQQPPSPTKARTQPAAKATPSKPEPAARPTTTGGGSLRVTGTPAARTSTPTSGSLRVNSTTAPKTSATPTPVASRVASPAGIGRIGAKK